MSLKTLSHKFEHFIVMIEDHLKIQQNSILDLARAKGIKDPTLDVDYIIDQLKQDEMSKK